MGFEVTVPVCCFRAACSSHSGLSRVRLLEPVRRFYDHQRGLSRSGRYEEREALQCRPPVGNQLSLGFGSISFGRPSTITVVEAAQVPSSFW